MNKRGLSTVITTLIIILLVLVAVGIVWIVIRNVITEGTEEVGLGKFTTDLEIKNVVVGESNINVSVKRNPGKGELTGIKFIFYDGENTETIEENISLEELEEKRFVFLSEDFIELNISNLEKVSIAGIFKSSSGKESVGNVADSYKVGEGSGGEECVPNCEGKPDCGDDGCPPYDETDCGTCPINQECIEGNCVLEATCNRPIIKTIYNTDYLIDDIFCYNFDGSNITGNVNWFRNGVMLSEHGTILLSGETSADDGIICRVFDTGNNTLCNSTELIVKDLIFLDLDFLVNEAKDNGFDNYTIPAGDYLISGMVNVPVDFSIFGSGDTTLTTNVSQNFFDLRSDNVGTKGNNVLRGITLEGRGVANQGIYSYRRSNILIEDMEIRNTIRRAIWVRGDSHYNEITINESVLSVCPGFDLEIDFDLMTRVSVTDVIYPLFKECPNFPDYMPEIAKNITIKNCVIENAGFTDSIYRAMVEGERVHGMNVSNCNLSGMNTTAIGIKIYDWGSFSYVSNNNINISRGIANRSSCSIEVFSGGWFSKYYKNNVNSWISADATPGAKMWENNITYDSLTSSYGLEAIVTPGAHFFNNFVKGASRGISIDKTNERSVFESNKILDSTWFGIQLFGVSDYGVFNVTLRNNLVYNTLRAGEYLGRGIYLCEDIYSTRIENNIIADSYDSALYLLKTYNIEVINNTLICWNIVGGEGKDIYQNHAVNTSFEFGFTRRCNFPCTENSDCDDFNSCTIDSCVGNVCQNIAVPDDTPCSDDLVCTENERCLKGYCVTDAIDCDDDITCTWDICDEDAGGCIHDTRDCSACYYDGKCNSEIGETSLTCPFECE